MPDNTLRDDNPSRAGLSEGEVTKRQRLYGLNITHTRKVSAISIFIRQLRTNPLMLILAAATFISFLLGQYGNSYLIFGTILLSVFLGFWNEYSAEKTMDTLLNKISPTALVIRDNEKKEILVSHLTVGDIVLLFQGSIIPADLKILDSKNLVINQAVLTGESEAVYKREGTAFMGTVVESGSGVGVVVNIGANTEFGKIVKSTTYLKPETEFQKGLMKFGRLIIKVVVILSLIVFGINALLGRQLIESLLFSLAIAIGLTPELLPIIVTIGLSRGAGKLAKKHVIAKQLISIENLGNMDVLCTDKTGTLTEGKIEVEDFVDFEGNRNENVLVAALWCNSAIIHHKVIGNQIDKALWEHALKSKISLSKNIKKIEEEPFDYDKKFMYSVIAEGAGRILLAKGAPEVIIAACKGVKNKEAERKKFETLSESGLRVIAIASKVIEKKSSYSWEDAYDLEFKGYITFSDTPKKSVREELLSLQRLNVSIKIVTGDNELVTLKVCKEVGMPVLGVLLGSQIDKLNNDQFKEAVTGVNVFARVNPSQKLRIIQTLRDLGHVVGYLGDGVNDVSSLRGADIGISVNTGVDVAKDAASLVILKKGLDVISDGIMEGRKTFSNTMKYILMGTSSNFGNMFSAAISSFFLAFLPMSPGQILLTNGLYDVSQMSIPSDNVDPESLLKPRHWNINFIKSYMIFFGPLSSIYDFITFFVMLNVFHATGPLFQTGWFIESLATEILVVFVIRTGRTPFFKSKPGKWLLITCLSVVAIGIIIPFIPNLEALGFISPPPLYFGILVVLTVTYLFLVELVKNVFLKRYRL